MSLAWSHPSDRRLIAFAEADRKLDARIKARLHPGRRAADRPSDTEWLAAKAARADAHRGGAR